MGYLDGGQQADYYLGTDGTPTHSRLELHGRLFERLGVTALDRAAFERLAAGCHPVTGARLVQSSHVPAGPVDPVSGQQPVRGGFHVPGTDCNLSPPKSVSARCPSSHPRVGPGLALIVAGLAVLTRAPVDGGYVVDVLPAMLLLGIGAGLAIPALATLATLATSRTDRLLAGGASTPSALTGGYHLAFGTGAGLTAAAIVLAATVLRRPRAGAQPEARVSIERMAGRSR